MTTYSNPAPLQLTLRGRRLIISLALGLILAVAMPALTDLAGANNQAGTKEQIATWVTIKPGDTLWAIAGEISPERDPREVVWEIKQLNDLSAGLIAGQQIRIPIY